MKQQRSTEQRSTVDSRCRLTNFKMSVSQSVSVSSQMLNPVLKTSSGTCQQFVEDAVKISNIFWIFDIHKVVKQHIAGVVEINSDIV